MNIGTLDVRQKHRLFTELLEKADAIKRLLDFAEKSIKYIQGNEDAEVDVSYFSGAYVRVPKDKILELFEQRHEQLLSRFQQVIALHEKGNLKDIADFLDSNPVLN